MRLESGEKFRPLKKLNRTEAANLWYEENKDKIDWNAKESQDRFRLTEQWILFSKELRNKHKECQCCSLKSKNLAVHHLDPKNYSNLDESRFAVLCHRCHSISEALSKRKDRAGIPEWWKQFLTKK
jgi:hypothetical protein